MKVVLSHREPSVQRVSHPYVTEKTVTFQPKQGDRIQIGAQARQLFDTSKQQSSVMEQLMKKREQIQEMRSNLIERTLEKGMDLSVIKEQLKEIDKQIQDVEMNMLKQQMKEREKALEELKKENEKPQEKKREETTDRLIEHGVSLDQMQLLNQSKSILDGERNTIKIELELDAHRFWDVDPTAESKGKKLANLDKRISDITDQLGERLGEVLKPDSEEQVKEDE